MPNVDRVHVAVVDSPDGASEVLLGAGSDQFLRFPLPKASPDRPVRFAVGHPSRRSSIWRLWANSSKDDVYLATRQSAGLFKISLHESGDWRLQRVGDDSSSTPWVASRGDEPTGRLLHQWRRPPPAPSGWTDAISIWVPEPDVADIPGDAERSDDVQWIEPPAPQHAVELRLMLGRSAPVALDMTPALHPGGTFALVNGFRLIGGETAVLFAATQPLSEQTRDSLAQTRREQRAAVPTGFDLDAASGPRAAAITVDRDGHRNVWDLTLT